MVMYKGENDFGQITNDKLLYLTKDDITAWALTNSFHKPETPYK